MLDLIRVDNVCSIKRGSQLKSSEAVRGKYPVVAGGILPSCFHNQFNRKGPVITISASGANAGYINYYNQNIFATDCSTIEESNNYDLKYDIILGGTADGRVSQITSGLRYGKIIPEEYELILDDFLKDSGKSYGTQIVFCTKESLSCINYIKCDIIQV